MNMRKRRIWFIVLIIIMGSIAYNIYDNQRFIVLEEEVWIDRLPASFDGFTILQITDLHGKYFGQHQANLLRTINRLDYDMIAFTGDMNHSYAQDDSIANSQAILDLIDGIENKDLMFWVDGNEGPFASVTFFGAHSGESTEIGKVLEQKGCILLRLPYAITRGDDTLWITPAMSEIGFESNYRSEDPGRLGGKEIYESVQAFYHRAYAAFSEIKDNGEVKIMLDHYPQQTNLPADVLETWGELDYDLILAGHYHGGQWRLPLIGALYVPSPTKGINNSGLFPPQDEVKGWSRHGSTPQYVSAGLGASDHPRWVGFRLFNTPEINLITLHSP